MPNPPTSAEVTSVPIGIVEEMKPLRICKDFFNTYAYAHSL